MGSAQPPKGANAFRTIGEVAAELNLPQHILRYWETRFPQLKPLQRAGNRRYYRPADVDLARRIHRLLNEEGYTIRGVRKLLEEGSADPPAAAAGGDAHAVPRRDPSGELHAIRDMLSSALSDDARRG